MTQHCACCGRPFEPRPQVPDQAYCSAPDCQRARKRQWQRAKLQSDPDYRINQRAAQQAWSQRNQDYWRNYREDRPEYVQRNREQQRLRDANGADVDLAKTGRVRLADWPVPNHAAPGVSEGKRRFLGRRDHAGLLDVSMQDGRVKRGLDRHPGDPLVTSTPNRLSNVLHGNDSDRVCCRRGAASHSLKGVADPRAPITE